MNPARERTIKGPNGPATKPPRNGGGVPFDEGRGVVFDLVADCTQNTWPQANLCTFVHPITVDQKHVSYAYVKLFWPTQYLRRFRGQAEMKWSCETTRFARTYWHGKHLSYSLWVTHSNTSPCVLNPHVGKEVRANLRYPIHYSSVFVVHLGWINCNH